MCVRISTGFALAFWLVLGALSPTLLEGLRVEFNVPVHATTYVLAPIGCAAMVIFLATRAANRYVDRKNGREDVWE